MGDGNDGRGYYATSDAALTMKGKAAPIMQHGKAGQRLLDIAASASAEEGIRQGVDDVEQERSRPAREFFADFEAEHRIPG